MAALACGANAWYGDAAARLQITVLSSRPEMVSGGDALVEVEGVSSGFRVLLNDRDVTPAVKLRSAESNTVGLLTGLRPGINEVVAISGASRKTARW